METYTNMEQQKPIIMELNENITTGFDKSLNALYNAVITYIKRITKTGTRVCQYNHTWHEPGYLISPVHIGFDGTAQNTVLQPETDIQKFMYAVRQNLISDQIKVARCEAKYISPNNINYLLHFVIDLEVPETHAPETNKNLAEPHEIDFKCASC